jgi:hypothetical protein
MSAESRCPTVGVQLPTMTNPEHLEHLDALRHTKAFPTNEDSAVRVVVRYFADRGWRAQTTRPAGSCEKGRLNS